MYINLDISNEIKKQIEEQVNAEIDNYLTDKNELNKLIKDVIKSQFKCRISELVQSQDFRTYMTDKIWKILLENENGN